MPRKYWSDVLSNPGALEPPDYLPANDSGSQRLYSHQWSRSLVFHYLKAWLIWGMFGILPFYWVPWDLRTCFWLQVCPWIAVGISLNHRFLDKLQMHHMVNAQDFASLKIKGVLLWAVVYFELILTFTTLALF